MSIDHGRPSGPAASEEAEPSSANGPAFRAPARGPRFDRPLAAGGYLWHYVDGISDDGRSALVIIAMQGHPFSPDYHRARRAGGASALRFCSMHVAVYGPGGRGDAFALEERPLPPRDRTADGVTIGRSAMRWVGDRLEVELDERTTGPAYSPFRRPVRGRVRLTPRARPAAWLPIDEAGAHRWWPVAPLARIEVDLSEPGLRFEGHGYHDANAGAAPLADAFERWSWLRARVGETAYVTYDVRHLGGTERAHALRVEADGSLDVLEPTWRAPLRRSWWGPSRTARVDEGAPARVVRGLEDGPFYTRALVETELGGARVVAMHESLAAQRLRRAWVRFCTGYRMARAG